MNLYQVTITVSGQQGPVMQMERRVSLRSLTAVKRALDRVDTDSAIVGLLTKKPHTLAQLAKATKRSVTTINERLAAIGAKPIGKAPRSKQLLYAIQ